MCDHVERQTISRPFRVGILGAYPPTPYGVARFGAGLSGALRAHHTEVDIVRVADGSPSSSARVVSELISGSARSTALCAAVLNHTDVAVIQYDYGIYGGVDGEDVLDLIDGLDIPSIAVAHTVPKLPTPHQRWLLERLVAEVDRVVVMSRVAQQRLCLDYSVDLCKVVTIPHGATVPSAPRAKRPSRPTILTWGLLRPGKGIERVIEAMISLGNAPGRPRYLVVGPTDPAVYATHGETYREHLVEQARQCGVADSVSFDDRSYAGPMLTALFQSAAVVALPYDSTDQVTSGVLVDAVSCGRPVVATAFPHAVELLSNGAGIVVGHDDPVALRTGLRRILTQPRLAGAMAGEARQQAPEMAWPVVAEAYLKLAHQLVAERRARR